jgi:hypothetical protein
MVSGPLSLATPGSRVVQRTGVEPARSFDHNALNVARLPFRHLCVVSGARLELARLSALASKTSVSAVSPSRRSTPDWIRTSTELALGELTLPLVYRSIVRREGLEPSHPFGHQLLRLACLPFHHLRMNQQSPRRDLEP